MKIEAEILEEFRELGSRASFHLADDTCGGEWRIGNNLMWDAIAIYRAHPELKAEMREIAKAFIWDRELDYEN